MINGTSLSEKHETDTVVEGLKGLAKNTAAAMFTIASLASQVVAQNTNESSVVNLSNHEISIQSGIPADQMRINCNLSVRVDDTIFPLLPNETRERFIFPDNMPFIAGDEKIEIFMSAADFTDNKNIDQRIVQRLCSEGETLIKKVPAEELLKETLLIALQRPILVFLQRSFSDDVVYQSRLPEVSEFRIKPLLELGTSRILGLYTPEEDNQNFYQSSILSGINPFLESVTDNFLFSEVQNFVQTPATPNNMSFGRIIDLAKDLQERSGLSEGEWPDIIILTSGTNNLRCSDLNSVLRRLPTQSGNSGSKLLILLDSRAQNSSLDLIHDEVCSPTGPFEDINIVTTHISDMIADYPYSMRENPDFQETQEIRNTYVGAFSD